MYIHTQLMPCLLLLPAQQCQGHALHHTLLCALDNRLRDARGTGLGPKDADAGVRGMQRQSGGGHGRRGDGRHGEDHRDGYEEVGGGEESMISLQ